MNEQVLIMNDTYIIQSYTITYKSYCIEVQYRTKQSRCFHSFDSIVPKLVNGISNNIQSYTHYKIDRGKNIDDRRG